MQATELFTNLGTSYRVVWHVGAGAVDSRGRNFGKNAGIDPEAFGARCAETRRPNRSGGCAQRRAGKAQLLTAMASGLRSIETPLLGRVEYANVDQQILALNLINGQIAALEGAPPRTQPVIALRGLWPRSIEGGIWQ